MELRVSLDEREDPDEEQEIEVEGIPFVVNEDVIDSYGLKYTIALSYKDIGRLQSVFELPHVDRRTVLSLMDL